MAMDQGYDGTSMWREPIATPNRNYKDTVFRDLFGSPERKANALELYNALNGTDYDDPDALELTTLDDVIYLNVKNDVSFLLADEMVLWEHQSTPNPNMPLRGLIYFGRLYSAYVESRGGNMYGARLIELPTPRYVVLYNGMQPRPAREVLRLSGAFPGENPSVEVTCEVVNVGSGCNPGVAEASPTLAGYVYLVERVRDYNGVRGMPPARAVDAAIDECVSKGYLASYLERKRSEVRSMFMTEFDEEKQRALDRRDGYEEGVEDGIGRGIEQGVKRAAERLRTAGYDEEIAQVVLGLNSDELLPPKPDGVHGSFMTEFDEEKQRALDRRDGYRDGFANGIDEGKKQGIEQGVAQAAERLRAAGYDEEAIRVVLGSRPAE